jgi:hypothetical protein
MEREMGEKDRKIEELEDTIEQVKVTIGSCNLIE